MLQSAAVSINVVLWDIWFTKSLIKYADEFLICNVEYTIA